MKKIITIAVICLMALAAFAQSTNTYEYDNLNRLTKVTYANGAVVQYTYDAVGNRLTKTVAGVYTQYTISASANPSNGGTVSGGGTYNHGSTCTLTATANTGYNFMNWTKDGTVVSTNATYSFTVTGNGTYVANFGQNTYTILASANPSNGGTVSGGGTYNHGSTCTLTATANTGYNFTNWTKDGTVVSTSASYSFTVTSSGTYVANFNQSQNTYTILASANPTGGGTVSGGGTYNYGANCTLTATANTGYIFTNWTENGTQVSTNASYAFTVTSDRMLVANFVEDINLPIPTAGLIAYYPFNGNANDESGNGNHGTLQGDVPQLTTDRFGNENSAYLFGGYYNQGWVYVPNSSSLQLDTAMSISFWMNLSGYDGMDGWGNYSNNAAQAIICKEGDRNGFNTCLNQHTDGRLNVHSWNNNGSYDINTYQDYTLGEWLHCVVTIENNLSRIYINGVLQQDSINNQVNFSNANNCNMYIGIMHAGGMWYPFNGKIDDVILYNRALTQQEVQLLYSVNDGLVAYYPFDGDVNDYSGNGNHGTIVGNVTPAADRFGNPNSAYSFPGYAFNYVSVPDTEILHLNTFTLSAWVYSEAGDYGGEHLINKGRDMTNGSYRLRVRGVHGQNDYNGINAAAIEEYPETGQWHMITGTVEGDQARFYIDGVLQSEATLSHPFNYNNTEPLTLGCHYYSGVPDFWAYTLNGIMDEVRIYSRVLTPQEVMLLYNPNFSFSSCNITASANPTEGGTVIGGGIYQQGQTCTLTATANTDYTFTNWTKDGTVVSTDAIYSFTVTGSGTYVANFSQNAFTISASVIPTAGGSVSGAGNYNYGETCTLTATANTGYNFVRWTKNGTQVSTNPTYSFTVTENANCVAYFRANSYTISASANPTEGGTVSGAGTYNHGSTCTLTATANTDYTFTNWTKDGTVVSTDAIYSFTVTGSGTYVANFSQNAFTISASAIPTTGGSVSGAGNYNYGETCTLTATANTGYNFVRWTKNGTQVSTNPTYSFTVTENANCVAYFRADSYTISASANPTEGGTVSGAGTYNHGTTCTLTATANTDYDFTNWTKDGTVVSIDATYSFTVTGSGTYVANFSQNAYTITASAIPTIGGSVSGAGTYNEGETCTLTATANTGYNFVRWTKNGTQVSTNPSYSFTVTENANCVAYFRANSYTISASANPTEGGTVSGAGTYNHGSTCTLTATANTDYDFTNWTKDGTVVSTDATYSFTVTGSGTYVANFSQSAFTISASAIPTIGGSVSGAGNYNYGETCTLTATANTGYNFVRWTKNGTQVSTNPSYSFTVTENANCVAYFRVNSYTISASANPTEGGTVSGTGTYNHGTTCTLTATANEDYTFVNWTENGEVVSTDAEYSFTVTGNRNLDANFGQNTYTISASAIPANGGSVSGAGNYNYGETCTLTATPNTGFSVVRWTKNGTQVSTDAIYSFTVTEDANCVAYFRVSSYTISASANPTEGGTVSGGGTYNHGITCILTATANEEYNFVNWTKDGTVVSTSAIYSFTVTSSATYVANFSQSTYTISASANPSNGGIVSGAGNYNYGETCTLTAIANTGYTFINWTKDGTVVSTSAIYSFTVTGSGTYVANFNQNNYTISVSANPTEGGTVNGGGTYHYGANCTLTATANTGYDFINWTKNGTQVSTIPTYSFTVTSSGSYVANFSQNTFTISASANPSNGGSVSGAGNYNYGETCTLTATANTGYNFTNWTKDGTVVSTSAIYSFTVTGSGTYVANFNHNNYTISASASPTEGGTVNGGGTYNYGATCTLTATANTGYNFVNWTENGTKVSTSANYSFTVIGNRNLVANFVEIGSGDHYVDLDLPSGLLWATCNVGANAPEEYGDYFAWGETQPKYHYELSSYQYCMGDFFTLTKYCTDPDFGYNGFTDNLTILLPEDDAATANRGDGWRMPTKEEWQELYQNTTVTWTQQNGVNGRLFTAPNGNSLFLPAAGCYSEHSNRLYDVGAGGYYWSSSLDPYYPEAAEDFRFNSDYYYMSDYYRYYGWSVRAVRSYGQELTWGITATPNPVAGGAVSGGGTYAEGAPCTLTATPAEGYTFIYWTENGQVVSYEAEYTFTVTGDMDLVANFVEGSLCSLTIEMYDSWDDGWTGNKLTVSDDLGGYNEVTLNGGLSGSTTLLVLDGSHITLGWIMGSDTYECSFNIRYANGNLIYHGENMSSDFSFEFDIDCVEMPATLFSITATASPNEGGTISGAGGYEYNSTCTLTATANTGYNFVNWTENGTVVSTNATYSFTVTENANCVAYFRVNSYTISASADPTAGGMVDITSLINESFDEYSIGDMIANEAIAAGHEWWTTWNNAPGSVEDGVVADFDGNQCAHFIYGNDQVLLLGNRTSGTFTCSFDMYIPNGKDAYNNVLHAFAGSGSEWAIQVYFKHFSHGTKIEVGGVSYNFDCPYDAWFNVKYNIDLDNDQATFYIDNVEIVTWQFSLQSSGSTGTRQLAALDFYPPTSTAVSEYYVDNVIIKGDSFSHGETCTLTATANTGYNFINWTKNGTVVSTEQNYSFTVTEDASYVANFELNGHTITATANPTEGGTVTGAGIYNYGDNCTLTATANEDYTFVNWTENGEVVSTDAEYSFTVTGNRNLIANFGQNTYTISASAIPSNSGSVCGAGNYNYGETCTLTATPNTGFSFIRWTKNGTHASTNATYSFTVTENASCVAYFRVSSYIISVSANPTEGGTVSGGGTFNHGSTCTLTATANEDYTFVNWTENGTEVSTNAIYSFTVTGNRNLVANFTSDSGGYYWTVNINQYPNTMTAIGVILINDVEQMTSTLELGVFCGTECRGRERLAYISQMDRYLLFLTMYGENGDVLNFRLYDHALGQELDVICTNSVTFATNNTLGTVVSPYEFSFMEGIQTQTSSLPEGWSWWSTYIEQEGIDGLTQLENSLGENGVMIKSQSEGFTSRYGEYWFGLLNSINNESSYLVQTSGSCDVSLTGHVAVPSEHPITLLPGWTWIGYPNNTAMSVSTALSNLNPSENDMLKAQESFSVYYPSIGWFGSLQTIMPGMGLMYESHNTSSVTLTYSNPTRTDNLAENVTARANHWNPDVYAYPNNMNVMAVVEVNGEELQSEDYELAAFANGECRGSAKLMYVEQLHRHMAFLTLHGDDEAELSFGLYDNATGMTAYKSDVRLIFAANAVAGSPDNPMVVSFSDITGIGSFGGTLHVFPNPVERGSMITIGTVEESVEVRVEIMNAIGAVLYTETSTRLPANIKAPEVPGVYMLRITSKGRGIRYVKLIVS